MIEVGDKVKWTAIDVIQDACSGEERVEERTMTGVVERIEENGFVRVKEKSGRRRVVSLDRLHKWPNSGV